MIRGFLVPTVLALALAGGLFVAPAQAQQFSADMVVNGGHGPAGNQPEKIYVSNGKMRMETRARSGGVMLADGKTKTAVLLMPQMKAYIDMSKMGMLSQALMPVDPANPCPQWQAMAKSFHKDDSNWSCKRIGPETVGGRATVKYQATSSKGEEAFAWVDPKLRFLVKSRDAKGNGIELKNIHEGAQPASLFEIPADYKKLDASMMMMPHGAKP